MKSAMNTALAPKSIALSIKRVMSTKLNLPAAVSIASNVAMPKRNPALGEAQGFTSIDGVSGPGYPVVLPVSRSDQLENALAVF